MQILASNQDNKARRQKIQQQVKPRFTTTSRAIRSINKVNKNSKVFKYVKVYGKFIKTNHQSKLNEDTMAKKQKSPELN